jgi:thymidylate kinase
MEEIAIKSKPLFNVQKPQTKDKRGCFVVVDGLDASGKGEIERALISFEQKNGKFTFDTISFCRAESKGLPDLEDFWNPPFRQYHTIITSEPTYAGIGKTIRKEIIANNSRNYPTEIEIQSYSTDRLIQMKQVVIPALKNNLTVIQSRCCAATLAYQLLRAEDEDKDSEAIKKIILEHEGNKLQLKWAPDLLIIPVIRDIEEIMRRIEERKTHEKDDAAIFDKYEFQKRLNAIFQSDWLKELFESHGTTVKYLDANISPESTRQQAVEIYKQFLDSRCLIY